MMLKKLELFMIKVLLLFLILCNSHYLDLLLKLSFMAFFWEIGSWKFRIKDFIYYTISLVGACVVSLFFRLYYYFKVNQLNYSIDLK